MTRFDGLRCEEVQDVLEAYVDGDLSTAEEARVRAHLGSCPSCATELALAEAIQRELRSLPIPDCPPEVLRKVVPFTRRRNARPLRSVLAAAMLAAAVGASVFFLGPFRQEEPDPQEVARATEEARYALAYIGQVSRRAGLTLRDHPEAEPGRP
ncbi:MAG: anti-sigma factor family protein [Thermoanaerobaculia bacterium]